MRFRFSLQKALEWTEVEESSVRMEIARLVKESERLSGRIREIDENLKRILESETRLSPQWAPYFSAKVPADAKERRDTEGKWREKQAEIGTKKSELNRLLLKRKGLESLKEKRLSDHRRSETRRDQKRLDDNYQILKSRVKPA